MSDGRAIVEALARAAERGERTVLATVARTEGSAYRGVGARMLVRADGSATGLVSGGCLEADLAAHAARVAMGDATEIVTYDARADDDLVWGLTLGCSGLVEVLLEPLGPARAAGLASLLARAYDGEHPSVLATVVEARGSGAPAVGARALITMPSPGRAGTVLRNGDWGYEFVLPKVLGDITEVVAHAGRDAERGIARDYAVGAVSARVSLELITPPVRLVLCGSGPDTVPVARLAAAMGWSVTVVDHRPVAHAKPERFPGARVAECADSGLLATAVPLTERTCAVVMSHHYARDLDYLDALLSAGVGYVGLLGPRARTERMLADLAARGRAPSAEMRDRLYAPVGLDLGGDGPDAIALAIVAEVAAVAGGRVGGHLRERRAPIHTPASMGTVASVAESAG